MRHLTQIGVFIIIIASSCGIIYYKSHGYWFAKDITDHDKTLMKFHELPESVRKTLSDYLLQDNHSAILSTDSTDKIWHELECYDSRYMSMFRKFGHRIQYNKHSYFIKYKVATPLVLDDSVVYYSESYNARPLKDSTVLYFRLNLDK